MSSRYLFGDGGTPPCIGEYEEGTARCFDCPGGENIRVACIEQKRLDDVSTDYGGMRRMPRPERRYVAKQPQPQPQAGGMIDSVYHKDFEPFQGESRGIRFVKNVGLDMLVTAASSLAVFARDFSWMPAPKKPQQVTLEVINTTNEDEEDDEEVG